MFLAEDDEYELLPKQEIEALKKELERLKKNPLGDLKEGENLLDSINELNNNIRKLIDIFTKAGADLDQQYNEFNPMGDLKAIRDQNEQIAHGIVAVGDMIKDMKEEHKKEEAEEEAKPVRQQGPRIPMVTSSPYDLNMGMQPPAPFPQGKDFPEEFSAQIPPPPQTSGFDNQTIPPLSQDKRRRSLFGRR
jgi:hypothetical protein